VSLRNTPSFRGLMPASSNASRAAEGSSKKANTKCELALRRALWASGLRYRVSGAGLPGRPDIVFTRDQVVVFCDGDFWHGRGLKSRITKLSRGHNAPYWVDKIRANVARDRTINARLRRAGWRVLRLWETDILRNPKAAAARVAVALEASEIADRRPRIARR
jgi:DNA mismatch endonuclease (patch repair protein)